MNTQLKEYRSDDSTSWELELVSISVEDEADGKGVDYHVRDGQSTASRDFEQAADSVANSN